ncbi:glycine cleavage system aminomethyltransferase GcvT [Leeia sp. TBRC 13508]|uniref:aminomethyltransferase n=1 Tax=Leeia speluncae TaxID=2884804 RepID=A0ABS8D2W9_9NEIS|nr:glycine cleavage system aminomethyltransferase GcvT [Leeia speluncae]MCB6182530.1 glycine cleavage system aminomethyltransferase GcvT [Leeia speluncae]
MSDTPLHRTALYQLHVDLGAKMVPFAGYDMPVQYPMGVLKEHLHTREKAGLFDVSHMGQVKLHGPNAASALETLVPVDLTTLPEGQQRYGFFTNEEGGILDDLMITNAGDHLFVVINAGCKEQDIAHMQAHLAGKCEIEVLAEHCLLALQGPTAAAALAKLSPETDFSSWVFMTARTLQLAGAACFVTRSGYSGEDGFEISVPNSHAEALSRALLALEDVAPIGLGARDSLRLEAGLCLYGHDIDTSTSPVEASLTWAIQKSRRAGGEREGGFPGAATILAQLQNGVSRKRVGLLGQERTPVREGAEIVNADGVVIGKVTSGGFGPSLGGVMALAYVETAYAAADTAVFALVRGKQVPMKVSKTPFVPQRYYRG